MITAGNRVRLRLPVDRREAREIERTNLVLATAGDVLCCAGGCRDLRRRLGREVDLLGLWGEGQRRQCGQSET